MAARVRTRSPSNFPRREHYSVYHEPHNHHHHHRDSHYHNEEHPARRARLRLPPLDPSNRYAGDGFDFRRPAMAPVEADRLGDVHAETIDLTREAEARPQNAAARRTQRLPRYGRDIIDISSSEDEFELRRAGSTPSPQHSHADLPSLDLPSSHGSPLFVPQDDGDDDELDFIQPSARTHMSSPPSRVISRTASVLPGANDRPRQGSAFIDLTEDVDDDLVMVDVRPIPSINRATPTLSTGVGTREPDAAQLNYMSDWAGMLNTRRLRDRIAAAYPDFSNITGGSYLPSIFRNPRPILSPRSQIELARARAARPPSTAHVHVRPGPLPGNMDFEIAGFDIGSSAGAQRRRVVEEPYVALDPPATGFTRSPAEHEEVVCPNCGSELAMGETEAQRQVWVLKQCGHAYCGTCVQARLTAKNGGRSRGKQRAGEPAILRKCAVDGCDNTKSVSKSNLVHVFLST